MLEMLVHAAATYMPLPHVAVHVLHEDCVPLPSWYCPPGQALHTMSAIAVHEDVINVPDEQLVVQGLQEVWVLAES